MTPLKTHINKFHRDHGKLVDFAGFEMPIWFEGIVPEHLAVRNEVGIFDVTHMGRSYVEGKDALDFLDCILTRDMASTAIYQGKYSVMCNEKGGIIDDLVVFRMEEKGFLMIYNASNREKNYEWMNTNVRRFSVKIREVSDTIAMFSVQGPESMNALQSISEFDLAGIRYYRGSWAKVGGFQVFITRTGYTGEDGFEIYLWDTPLDNPDNAMRLWKNILEAGQEHGIKPCGLGARDTLRIEAGMCLYGNDINESITPLEARLDFAVQLDKEEFIGRNSLLKQKSQGPNRPRVGIRLLEKGIPRSGNRIFLDDEEIGELTSGTFSPLLKYGIGLGYVRSDNAEVGNKVYVLLRNRLAKAEIVEMPFYDTSKYGRRRERLN